MTDQPAEQPFSEWLQQVSAVAREVRRVGSSSFAERALIRTEREIRRLQAENDSLREQLKAAHEVGRALAEQDHALERTYGKVI